MCQAFFLEALLLRSQNHDHVAAFHFGRLFHNTVLFEFFPDPFQNLHPQLGIRDLPTPKEDGDLGLIFLPKETLDVSNLDLQIVFIGLRADFDLFYLDDGLFFLGLLSPLVLLVFEFAKIHDLADRRFCVWSHLNKIQLILSSQFQGLLQR
jgi:hypothetical protein